jgi:MurNAc alpha-1-phosphate uridylyltransferase
MTLPVAILAGGEGRRLRPLTETIPKSLVSVAGKPFAVYQLELLRARGYSRVIFCVGYLGEQIQDALGDGSRFQMQIEYSFDGLRPLGTGGATKNACGMLGDAFFVMYGDSYLECAYQAVEDRFLASARVGLMTVFRDSNGTQPNNVLYSNGAILAYSKQSPPAGALHIDYGLLAFRREAFEQYRPNTPFDLDDVFHDLIRIGELEGVEIDVPFLEMGSLQGWRTLQAHLREG